MANIITTTICDLRTSVIPAAGDIFFTVDQGQEGEWKFVGTETLSGVIDNTGTLLTSGWSGTLTPCETPPSSGTVNIYKRIYDPGYINVTWFGARGDGSVDDAPAINNALKFASDNDYSSIQTHTTGGCIVFFPKGLYRIKSTLIVGANVRLQGVSKVRFDKPNQNYGNGSIIQCFFAENPNQWAISTASYEIDNSSGSPVVTPVLWPYDKPVTEADFNKPTVVRCNGIVIDGLYIEGTYEGTTAFGGVRLAATIGCVIQNTSVLGTKVGYMFTGNYGGGVIQNSYCGTIWYGIVLCIGASITVSGCDINGNVWWNPALIKDEVLPAFIDRGEDHSYSYWGLDDALTPNNNVKNGTDGIYAANVPDLNITGTVSQYFHNGIVLLGCRSHVSSVHIEGSYNYGIVSGINENQLIMNQMLIGGFERKDAVSYSFYFGKGVIADITGYSTRIARPDHIYVDNDTSGRNIKFDSHLSGIRVYKPDIQFLDEGAKGFNYGAVYVDPDYGSDLNYGFNINDPVKSFDAAIVRVQNQNTANPVRTIYLKAAVAIEDAVKPWEGAVSKDPTIRSLENCNILVTSYNVSTSHPRARLVFQATGEHVDIMVGQIELLGNVHICFRNVEIYCNQPGVPIDFPNLSLFGLRNCYANVTFESNVNIISSPTTHPTINLSQHYYLFQANNGFYTMGGEPKSYLNVQFVNVEIVNGPGLSPVQFGNQDLAVNCVAINSFNWTTSGWQDIEAVNIYPSGW